MSMPNRPRWMSGAQERKLRKERKAKWLLDQEREGGTSQVSQEANGELESTSIRMESSIPKLCEGVEVGKNATSGPRRPVLHLKKPMNIADVGCKEKRHV